MPRLKISTTLNLLLLAMLAVLVAALAVPTLSAVAQRDEAARIVGLARAGRSVFNALRYLRPERGTVRVGLENAEPAEPEILASIAASRVSALAAVADVMRDCQAAGCADDDPGLSGVRQSHDALLTARREVDAALRLPLRARPAGASAAWNAAATDLVSRLERISALLMDRIRVVDAPSAELMSIKQLGWMIRDAAGLERSLYNGGIDAKALSPAVQTRMVGYRARIVADWPELRALVARPGAPPPVVLAIRNAEERYFGKVEKARAALHTALVASQPSPFTGAEWLRLSDDGIDALMEVPTAAVEEAGVYSEQRAADAAVGYGGSSGCWRPDCSSARSASSWYGVR